MEAKRNFEAEYSFVVLWLVIAFALGTAWALAWYICHRNPEWMTITFWSLTSSSVLTNGYRAIYPRLKRKPSFWQLVGWPMTVVFIGTMLLHDARPQTRFTFLGGHEMTKAVDSSTYMQSVYVIPADSTRLIPLAHAELQQKGYELHKENEEWLGWKGDDPIYVKLYKGRLTNSAWINYPEAIATDQAQNWVTVIVREYNPWFRQIAP